MTELPIHFAKPDDNISLHLFALLEELPIVSERELLDATAWREDLPAIGSKAEVVALIEDALKRDYAENLAEAKNEPWFFDYEIDDYSPAETESLEGLGIFTRLISYDPKDGKILYGRTTFRTAQDRFVCWLE